MGYPLDTIFVAGHSMGGAFLETYIPDNLRPNYAGVLLFGSWIAREGHHSYMTSASAIRRPERGGAKGGHALIIHSK